MVSYWVPIGFLLGSYWVPIGASVERFLLEGSYWDLNQPSRVHTGEIEVPGPSVAKFGGSGGKVPNSETIQDILFPLIDSNWPPWGVKTRAPSRMNRSGAGHDWTRPVRTGRDRIGSHGIGADRAGPDWTGPLDRTGPEDWTGQDRTTLDGTGRDLIGLDRNGADGAGQDTAGPDWTGEDRTVRGRTGTHWIGPDGTGLDRMGQDGTVPD